MFSKRYREHWIVLTWGMVGLGLGLVALSTMLWLRQTGLLSTHDQELHVDAQLSSALVLLRAGQLPESSPAMQGEWTSLWTALNSLQKQRQAALATYETQISQASPSAWMTPEQLVRAQGRAELAKRLAQLDNALREWSQREAAIQNEFDSALNAWLVKTPAWMPTQVQQQFLDASTDAASVVKEYVQLEQDLLAQIRHLSDHIAGLEGQVALTKSTNALPSQGVPSSELVFNKTADLNRYQSSVNRLSELAGQEQTLMVRVRQLDQQHRKRLAQAIDSAVSMPTAR